MIMILLIYLNLSAFSDPSLVQFIHRNLAYIIGFFIYLYFIKFIKIKFIICINQ